MAPKDRSAVIGELFSPEFPKFGISEKLYQDTDAFCHYL